LAVHENPEPSNFSWPDEFLDLVIDHLTARGVMDPSLLYESPFTDFDSKGVEGVHRYRSDNWRSATEARAGITIATGHRAQSDGITIATEHRYQSDNWRSAGEARAGITTGHRSERITITIAARHRYQSDNWRWAGEADQRGHVNRPSGCESVNVFRTSRLHRESRTGRPPQGFRTTAFSDQE
jgi:hypothetical protein